MKGRTEELSEKRKVSKRTDRLQTQKLCNWGSQVFDLHFHPKINAMNDFQQFQLKKRDVSWDNGAFPIC